MPSYPYPNRLQMAVDLNCKPSEIVEKLVDVPQAYLARVIGKSGSNIKEIESKFKVRCDVLKNEMKIKVSGSDEAASSAIDSIENITLAVDVTIDLRKEVVNSLLSNKAALLNEIQTSLNNIRLSIPKKSNTLTIRGRQDVIDQAIERIKSLDIHAAYLTFTPRELGIVIGKGGETIKELEAAHNVKIEVLSRSEGAADNLQIVGSAHDVEKANNAIELLVSENEVLEEEMEVTQAHRNLFLSDTAAVFKEIQKESGAYLRMSANSQQSNYKSGIPAAPSTMTIKGTRAQISAARTLVEGKK